MNGEEWLHTYASQLADVAHVIPLGVGLPLSLAARANAVADVRGNIRANLKLLLSRGKGDFVWQFHPSAAVNFDGAMTVDAVAVKGMHQFQYEYDYIIIQCYS